MNNEQLQKFGDLVSKVKFDGTITYGITTRKDNQSIRTARTENDVALSAAITGGAITLWLNPSEAMAVAASLVAQVLRIANAKDAEQ